MNSQKENFLPLPHILGQSLATETTVALFNTSRPIKKDHKGKYIIMAVRPYMNGVITQKKYIRLA